MFWKTSVNQQVVPVIKEACLRPGHNSRDHSSSIRPNKMQYSAFLLECGKVFLNGGFMRVIGGCGDLSEPGVQGIFSSKEIAPQAIFIIMQEQ